jgi:hypothetical protein
MQPERDADHASPIGLMLEMSVIFICPPSHVVSCRDVRYGDKSVISRTHAVDFSML